ncbi:MAG TPA: PAS domain S-box protein [Usitatibacter sp.]|nr:PAS domain S-box protein [Usitatibacter sp.]
MTDPRSESSHPGSYRLSPEQWGDQPFRRLVESVRDYAIFLLDTEGNILSWNTGAQQLKGYSAAEIIGRNFSLFYPQAAVDRRWPQCELETAARLGRFEDEGWRVRKDGTRFWANVIITALRNDEGELIGFAKVTRDLSERRRNEERVRESEERFRLLVEGVQDYAIFMLDPDGRVASWNQGARRIKGYEASEVIGKNFSIFYPPEAIARDWPATELREAARIGHFEDEGWRVRRDGTRFWANVVITALRGADGELRGFSKITRDLSDRRIQEEKLRLSEERFRLLLEGIEDYAIFMLDPVGRVTSWNTGAQRMTGYTEPEILGESIERFYLPDDTAAGRPAQDLRQATLNRRSEDLGWRLRKDGERFWAETVLTALHDDHGRLRGFAQVTRDMTERKRMESLERQGRRLTEFLAMLAHELRNPLAPIRNAVTIMGAHRDLPAQVAWSRDVIERQTGQLARLVDDLLDVSRITRGKLRMKGEPMDLNLAVHRAIEASRPLIDARRQSLEVRLSEEPLPVHGDMTRLTQVVVNLLNNAAKYTPEEGRVQVRTARDGEDCLVRVCDNGMGIPPYLLDRVFDLFAQGERTLDRSEGGLGIGLTLARRIVVLHGGSIVARSDGVGYGAEFEVRLPRLETQLHDSVQPGGDVEARGGESRRSILVVDDNEDAAASLAMLLRMTGHEVVIEHDGEGALVRIAARTPDIVLLDIGLPGMSGYDVAARLRDDPRRASMRVYALTGYGQEEDRRRSAEAGFDGHLVKPVLPTELFALIDASPVAASR